MIDVYALATVYLMEHRRALTQGFRPDYAEPGFPLSQPRRGVALRFVAWLRERYRGFAMPEATLAVAKAQALEAEAKC